MGTSDILVHDLVRKGVIKTPQIIAAFQAIDRAAFVPEELQHLAYLDRPLSIGHGQTISQPTTVAIMLESLQPKPGQKVLDVGSGSGWTTALLGQLVGPEGSVYGVEVVPELVSFGQGNIAKFSMPWCSIHQSGDQLGLPQHCPFDRILVSAAADHVPDGLIEQLSSQGKLVIPVKDELITLDKRDGQTIQTALPGFAFVPLVQEKTG